MATANGKTSILSKGFFRTTIRSKYANWGSRSDLPVLTDSQYGFAVGLPVENEWPNGHSMDSTLSIVFIKCYRSLGEKNAQKSEDPSLPKPASAAHLFPGRLPMCEHFIESLPFRPIGFYPPFNAQRSIRGRKAKAFQEARRSRGKAITVKKHLPEVITVRTFKEYVEESLLIVFSVVLALFLTMLYQNLHEDSQMREVTHELREELISNKKAEEVQLRYHLQVLKNIDSALADPAMAQQFINNGALNLKIIAPEGVLNRDLNDVVWQVARQNNVFARLDLSTYSLLNTIYDNQQRIMKSESEVAKVLESWDSRKPENLRTTLILLKDNYLGWAVERAPALLTKYQEAIDKLSNY